MHRRIVFKLLLMFCFALVQGKSKQQGFDKSAFYSVIESGTKDEIDVQLNKVKSAAIPTQAAFEGALLMKKAGLVTKAKEKLSLFKSGRTKLESAISKDRENIEYRFLRLIIQEHAPKIVNYRNELKEDSQLLLASFKTLSPFLQQRIIDYSKKSKVLKTPGNFPSHE